MPSRGSRSSNKAVSRLADVLVKVGGDLEWVLVEGNHEYQLEIYSTAIVSAKVHPSNPGNKITLNLE